MSLPVSPLQPSPLKTQGDSADLSPVKSSAAKKSFAAKSGVLGVPIKVGLFGPGGVGKTKLITLAKSLGLKVLLIDLERGSHYLDVDRVDDVETWDELLAVLRCKDLMAQYDLIGIDSFTRAEEMSAAWVPRNVNASKTGEKPAHPSLDSYPFGEGMTFQYENFLQLLAELDKLVRNGKHVAFTCHDCISEVPNPNGENYIRYEPRLQSPKGGKNSIRLRVREWTDHLLFIGYTVMATTAGKGAGSGKRFIYPTEMPTHMAKSRTLGQKIEYFDNDTTLWKKLLNKE